MTEQELQAIEAREAGAAPGPWTHRVYDCSTHEDGGDEDIVTGPRTSLVELTMHEADARFVVGARQDVPALVAEIRRLQWLVKHVEWTDAGRYEYLTCPWCFAEHPGPHKPTCPAFGESR